MHKELRQRTDRLRSSHSSRQEAGGTAQGVVLGGVLNATLIMQIGQFIGTRADFVPEPICKKLSLLQDKVPCLLTRVQPTSVLCRPEISKGLNLYSLCF